VVSALKTDTAQAPVDLPVGLVCECELADGVAPIATPRPGIEALVLVRVFTEPIGTVTVTLGPDGISASELAEAIVSEFGDAIRERMEECGLEWTGDLPQDGLRPPRTPRFVQSRERVLRVGPQMTVAICTHGRAESLPAALESVLAQHYDRLRLLVIDNAPVDDRNQKIVSSFSSDLDIEYAVEPRKGLSWARNLAIELADGDVITWVDDDAVCDPWWAAELARAFVEVPDADAVTGPIMPTELHTPAQMFFEQYASVRRARGFDRAIFSPATKRVQSPLYPSPPFGIGANMAFRLQALERVGRFDCALGAGTVTRTGEDTAALSALLLSGGTVVYQPTAIMRHNHRRDGDTLDDLLLGHGRGVGAFYTSMLIRRPSSVLELLTLLPRALRDQFSKRGPRLAKLDQSFPPELLRSNRIGILQGPFAYAIARRAVRRLRDPVRDAAPGV
jgi:glycosyltransferase involved in cell wall biosynthesis